MLVVALAGGVTFGASLVYFGAAYVGPFGVPQPDGPWLGPTAIDVALFSVFALHHSVFARAGLKAVVTRLAPPQLERSIYVWIASLLLIAVCALWQPVPGVWWSVSSDTGRLALRGVQAVAMIAAVLFARRLDVFLLAGVRQVLGGPKPPAPPLEERGPYAIVRHPIYLAWLFVVWPVAMMTGTRFVFVATSTLYLALAVPFEERDLVRQYGAAYTRYQQRVRWRIVPFLF